MVTKMVRDKKGRFVKGHESITPGRPKKSREERYLEILISTVTEQDWQAIIMRAVADAKRGDATARKWLADYIIGPPVERKEISGADGNALRIEIVDVDSQH